MAEHPGNVAILLALYQGAAYLRPQLDSLAAQTHRDISLHLGDDGSTDGSTAIVTDFASAHPDLPITISQGPRQGPAANFRHMLHHVPEQAEFVAFCDQDDVWLDDKLARATHALSHVTGPAIWCSRATICSDDLIPKGTTPALRRNPSFRNALIQNIVIGHTLTMNRAAYALVLAADAQTGPVAMHDWWVYQLVTGAGGQVIWDDQPSTLYRQHGRNAVGAADGVSGKIAALRRMVAGNQQGWNQTNLAALEAVADQLTPDNRAILQQFRRMQSRPPQCGPLGRITALRRSGIHRQTPAAQTALWLAALLGWL